MSELNIYQTKKNKVLKLSKKKYFIAVGLLFLSSTLLYFVHQYSSDIRAKDYQIINFSGRQRMLSQKIALYSHSIESKSESERINAIGEFKKGMREIENSRFMRDGLITRKIFFDDQGTRNLSLNFLETSESGSFDDVKKAAFKVLESYDQLTHEIQREAEKEFLYSNRMELIFYLLTLALLLFEVMFIFRPLLKSIKENFDELESSNDAVIHLSNLSLLGESVSTLGHEIANPLTVIKITAQTIETQDKNKERDNGHELEKKVNTIISQAERIEKMIKSIKGLARKSGQDPYVFEQMSRIIDDALILHANKIKNQNVNIVIHLDEKLEKILCHPGEIVQVISNLVGNAIDATGSNANPTIEIASKVQDKTLIINVLDNGTGVSKENVNRIFNSFFTTKSVDKGTGLGLSVAKRIIENHGGKIFLNQNEQRTCFQIELPLTNAAI
jgi:signal transduction histidine kinase